MGRQTVKEFDRATLSYDDQGRVIFILQKDFSEKVGNTTKGDETKTNQVILSTQGKIISSFPVDTGGKGWVGNGELQGHGANFMDLMIAKSSSPEIQKRHEPFLSDTPDAVRSNLYIHVPYGVINQRTRAYFLEKASSTNANSPGTHQEEITILKKGKPVKVMATVAEMRFAQPIGVREEVGPDGRMKPVPLYYNRTYFIEGN